VARLRGAADGRNVYEALRESEEYCWVAFADHRPSPPDCGCTHCRLARGEPVTVQGWEIPRELRRVGRWDRVTVYPDGRIEEALSHDVHGPLGSGCPPPANR
jgi:hypothetical protein